MNLAIPMLIIIVAVILLGFVTKVNTGLIAMAVAYGIGSFVMGISPAKLQALWPAKIFFVLFAVSFFYNYSTNNGTMDKLARHILFKFGKSARLFPFVIMLVAWLMSAAGAGAYSIIALLCPVCFILAEEIGMSKLLIAMSVYYGAVGAAPFPTCSTGATQRAVIEQAGFVEESFRYGIYNAVAITVFFFIALIILYVVLGGHRVSGKTIQIEKPEPFDDIQKKSLGLIIAFIVILLVPFILGQIFRGNVLITMLTKYNDVAFTAIILSIIATLMKIGDEKKALFSVPWHTIVMICGISIIVSVAVEAGTIEMITTAVSKTENAFMVPIIMSFGAGIMSIFSSTTGVVLPTLYPTVPAIAEATGVLPLLLLMGINMGSCATGMSPFSACGGIIMGCVSDRDAKKMYQNLLILPFCMLVLGVLLVAIMVPFFSA